VSPRECDCPAPPCTCAPRPVESTGELREAIRQLIHDDREMGYSESTSDELTDALLSGPLAPLLAKLRAVEELAAKWKRHSVFHAEYGARETAVGLMHRVNDLRRALDPS
jgi:hypothetical protein